MSEAGFKSIVMTTFARLNRVNKGLHRHLVKTGGTSLLDPGAEELLAVIGEDSDDSITEITHFFQQNNLLALSIAAADRIFVRRAEAGTVPSPTRILHQLRRYESLGLFEAVERLAKHYGERRPHPALDLLLARMLVDRGAYDAALAVIARGGQDEEWASLLKRIEAERPLVESERSGPGRSYDVAVVNLVQDYARRDMSLAAMRRGGLDFRIVPAIRVDEIPASDQGLFRKPLRRLEDGSFGNQATQYRIWRKAADEGADLTAVFEDDTCASMALEPFLRHAPIPEDAEIIFFNNRLCGESDRLTVRPIGEALADTSRRHPGLRAPGADGYILSRSGAEKLARIVKIEKFHSPGTDWYILAHSIRREELALLNPDSVLFQALNTRCHGAEFADIVLNGYMTSLPLGYNRPLGAARFNRV
ncbi:hypothetical protein ASG52_05880 [Methylobacterium sp. Leaf456]|uniref:glycosyltransferase family 25 protein n=1 Tax=Methylobacterium sp. Leaf456 TaxID=1736382 RepID=UPI0006FEDF24|nr:glycosyltransferase family 25 protein [Methylobacterium sp. Leaf456]KQT50352.1 hypothetical protein ASG52_05880 [Methylobacterium sp. Leaf456]